MPKRIRAARHYQDRRAPLRVMADAGIPKIKRPVKEALAHLGTLLPPNAVQFARAGDWYGLRREIDWRHFREVLTNTFASIGKVRLAAAEYGAQQINGKFAQARRRVRFRKQEGVYSLDALFEKDVGDRFSFDLFDEDTQARIRAAQDELIQQIEAGARDAIETIVLNGAQQGLSPEDIIADIRSQIGLTDRQAQAVANYQQMLSDLDPQALARQLRNGNYDEVLQDAIDSGQDLSDAMIEQMTQDYADNFLDYRAETIARTEATRAASAGLQDSYLQAVDRGVFPADAVTQFWVVAMDEKTCLPAGTLVATSLGEVPIERLRIGDAIKTRRGERKLRAIMTSSSSKTLVSLIGDGIRIVMTSDHHLLVNGQWREAREVKPGDSLHGVSNEAIKIGLVCHIEFADANRLPSLQCESRIPLGILDRIVPKNAINLDCDFVLRQCKINAVSPDLIFLLKCNSPGEREANGALWECFAVEAAIATERAKLSIVSARKFSKSLIALSAVNHFRWASALLGTMLAEPTVVLNEDLSASLAWNSHCDRQTALSRTHDIAVRNGFWYRESLAASRARLGDIYRRVVASPRAKALSALGCGCGAIKKLFAGLARNFRSSADHRAGFEGTLTRILGFRHDGNPIPVYDLEVDDEHEFFANGVLVHNCEVCLSIPDMNPDGVALGEPFDSIDGQMDAPPDPHTSCRCNLEMVTDLDKVPTDEGS